MKVLLLYPEFPDTFWSFKHALKFIRKRASVPPLGLLTVAAMLPPSWEKRLVDLNVRKLTDKHLRWADLVFISAMIVQRESVKALIARCRAAGKTIVAGGPLFTSEYSQFPGVDHFVLNEAEVTLPEFLRDLEQGCARRVYAPAEFPDIRQTPAPLWELAELRRYASMCIQYSRGCPFDCEFCDVTVRFGHRPRTKTAAQIIAELDSLHRLGWRGPVFFVDDNLIGNKRALKTELLPALIDWQEGRRGVPLYTEASINLADDEELMHLMAEAGFDMVFIGIETPDESSLAECNKRQNQHRDLVADVKRIQRAGLQVQGGFIVGFDSDTPTIFHRQIEFIQKSGIVTAMVGLLNALPDTKLYARLKREGRLLGPEHGGQPGRYDELCPVHEDGGVARGVSEHSEAHLCAGAVLSACPHLSARIQAPEVFRFAGLAADDGVRAFQRALGCPRSGTLPVLAAPDLDILPPARAFPAGGHALHLRPPLPQVLRGDGRVAAGGRFRLADAGSYQSRCGNRPPAPAPPV